MNLKEHSQELEDLGHVVSEASCWCEVHLALKYHKISMTKFEIYQDRAGNYRWRLKALNGEIVAISEGYITRFGARKSAEAVKRIAFSAIIVDPVLRYMS